MRTITVSKEDLIATLRENRDSHRDIFIAAQQAYRDKMIEELDRALAEARTGGQIRRDFTLPVPEDHTEDFNTAIAMLEWHQAKTVELEQYEFQQYVENEWGWQKSWAANTAAYVVGS
jgi:hypothetical protein